MQCACAILSSVACPTLQYFFLLSYKRHDFRKKKKVTEHKMCVFRFSLQLLSETFLIIRRNELDMIKNVYRSSCEVPVVLWWASNPDTWTGFEILFSYLTCSPFPRLQTATCSWDHFLYTHSGHEPSSTNSWAGQCRAVATRLHNFGYYICSRFWSTERVRNTYVHSGVNKSFVYPERFVNKRLVY